MGSLNLAAFVENKKFNFEEFNSTIITAIHYLNDVLDEGLAKHPLEEQRRTVAQWRQCGLGIMGLADMLINMELSYNSSEARNFCEKIGKDLINSALRGSSMAAFEREYAYPGYNEKIMQTPFYKTNADDDTTSYIREFGLLNSQLLTIAPTGTISTMLGISGGIEPIFANSYTRKTQSLYGHDEYYKVYTPIVEDYMGSHNISNEEDLPAWFETSATIAPLDRVLMQSVWQSHIDASISSTVNLPKTATVEDVKDIYLNAWRNGLKGITVYRSGCLREGVLTIDEKKEDKTSSAVLGRGDIIKVDNSPIGLKRDIHGGCGCIHIQAFFDPLNGTLQEVYCAKGSEGGCQGFMVGLSRMMSLAARGGVDIEDIIDQLESTVTCPAYAVRKATKGDTSPGSSCPAAIGRALKEMSDEMIDWIDSGDGVKTKIEKNSGKRIESKVQVEKKIPILKEGNKCPECGGDLVREGGCNICKNCGWSRCS